MKLQEFLNTLNEVDEINFKFTRYKRGRLRCKLRTYDVRLYQATRLSEHKGCSNIIEELIENKIIKTQNFDLCRFAYNEKIKNVLKNSYEIEKFYDSTKNINLLKNYRLESPRQTLKKYVAVEHLKHMFPDVKFNVNEKYITIPSLSLLISSDLQTTTEFIRNIKLCLANGMNYAVITSYLNPHSLINDEVIALRIVTVEEEFHNIVDSLLIEDNQELLLKAQNSTKYISKTREVPISLINTPTLKSCLLCKNIRRFKPINIDCEVDLVKEINNYTTRDFCKYTMSNFNCLSTDINCEYYCEHSSSQELQEINT